MLTRSRPHQRGAAHLCPGTRLVAITGGIGSGKSLVCEQFARLGRTVLSADRLAREVMESDAVLAGELRNAFGDAIYTAGHTLDRKALAGVVFRDPHALATLNTIVHPRVFTVLAERLSALPEEKRAPYTIIEAALVFESGMDARVDRVIVVEAPSDVRIARVVARDRVSREEVVRRMKAQIDPARAMERADFIVHNGGDPELLGGPIRFLDSLLRGI